MNRLAVHEGGKAVPGRHAPSAPATLAAAGLPPALLQDLILKHLHVAGELTVAVLARRLGLPRSLVSEQLEAQRSERLVEVPRRGQLDADVAYALTDAGRDRAGAAMQRSQYVGIAPVPLAQYVEQVRLQAQERPEYTEATLSTALGDFLLPDRLRHQLGAALNSGRAIYLWGDAGAGKSYLAEYLARVMGGHIWVPHALLVDDQIIAFHDPLTHRPVAAARIATLAAHDARWIEVERPAVIIGGELTLDTLELQFDALRRCYNAPPQLRANNGVLVVDDLGRQRVDPAELLNRWIVPLDRRRDLLRLHTGTRFEVPFELTVVFSSNLAPSALADPAFTRRLGYRLRLGALAEEDYRRIVAAACERFGLRFDEGAWRHLLALHRRDGVPLLPVHPRDLLRMVIDEARYRSRSPEWTPAAMERAWSLHFDIAAPAAAPLEETLA